MKKRKIRVGILFGGKSAEHDVSVQSAKNIIAAIDTKKYVAVPFKIDREGKRYAKIPWKLFDVAFPVLHGPNGEDGAMQGLLKLVGMPFVGPGILGSAVGMDKDIAKRLLRDAGIPVAKFLVLHPHLDVERPSDTVFDKAVHRLGLPFFIKPANLGSSVGVHKVKNREQFVSALRDASRYDTKILIEEYIRGREIECAVLGNEHPLASVPGEIIPHHEFYSYEAKYLDPDGAKLAIPAKLPAPIMKKVQRLAVKTFTTLSCEGMGRVDFFLTPKGKLYVNEINTIPGFTKISMYPKLWEASGVSYSRLIDRLIRLALARFAQEKKLKTER